MHKIILGIALVISLAACSMNGFVGGVAAIQTADTAKHVLAEYIGDDEIANARVKIPLEALDAILVEAKKVDSTMAMYEFATKNLWMIKQGRAHYIEIYNAVGEYYQRTGIKPPAELVTYNNDVTTAYTELLQAIVKRDKAVQAGEFVKVLVKILAARRGIIV